MSKAAAGLRVPYGASMPVACAAPSLGSCLRLRSLPAPHESYSQMGTQESRGSRVGVGGWVGAPLSGASSRTPPLIAIRACAGVRPHDPDRSDHHSSTSHPSPAALLVLHWGGRSGAEEEESFRLEGKNSQGSLCFAYQHVNSTEGDRKEVEDSNVEKKGVARNTKAIVLL